MSLRTSTWIAAAAVATLASSGFGAFSISALSTFGGGDGWRAPTEVVTGDTTGTATAGSYNYLGVGSLERGLAYNRTTGNLVLVSRSGSGNGIRLLSGTSGADVGALNQGTGIISGGTFTTSAVSTGTDGAIYVSNLTTNAQTSPFKVYRWASEAATIDSTPAIATSASGATAASAGRLGDDLDAIGGGSTLRLAAGYSTGIQGYVVLNPTAGSVNNVLSFSPTLPGATTGDFRLGITFAGADTKVWGKQTGVSAERRTTVTGAGTASYDGADTFASAGETAQDFISIGGHAFISLIDINNSFVRVYNVDDAANPVLLGGLTTTTGLTATNANGNAVGAVAWGPTSLVDYDNASATLYAMSTNQGVQAFTINLPIPEPTSLAAIAGLGITVLRRRRA